MIYTEDQVKTRANHVLNLKYAEAEVVRRQQQLDDFDQAPENNVFDCLDDAYELEEVLRDRAYQDCQGSYNCGQSEYEQAFLVHGQEFVAVAKVEYNRHDKQYYYIDGFDFEIHDRRDTK